MKSTQPIILRKDVAADLMKFLIQSHWFDTPVYNGTARSCWHWLTRNKSSQNQWSTVPNSIKLITARQHRQPWVFHSNTKYTLKLEREKTLKMLVNYLKGWKGEGHKILRLCWRICWWPFFFLLYYRGWATTFLLNSQRDSSPLLYKMNVIPPYNEAVSLRSTTVVICSSNHLLLSVRKMVRQ
jgi:hypothetical protein